MNTSRSAESPSRFPSSDLAWTFTCSTFPCGPETFAAAGGSFVCACPHKQRAMHNATAAPQVDFISTVPPAQIPSLTESPQYSRGGGKGPCVHRPARPRSSSRPLPLATPNPRSSVAIFCARFSASPGFSVSRCPFDRRLVARYPATFTFVAPDCFAYAAASVTTLLRAEFEIVVVEGIEHRELLPAGQRLDAAALTNSRGREEGPAPRAAAGASIPGSAGNSVLHARLISFTTEMETGLSGMPPQTRGPGDDGPFDQHFVFQLRRVKIAGDVLLDSQIIDLAIVLGQETRNRFGVAHDRAGDETSLLTECRGASRHDHEHEYESLPSICVRSCSFRADIRSPSR